MKNYILKILIIVLAILFMLNLNCLATSNDVFSDETSQEIMQSNDTTYNVVLNIYTVLCVLTFTQIIVFLSECLKLFFKYKLGG